MYVYCQKCLSSCGFIHPVASFPGRFAKWPGNEASIPDAHLPEVLQGKGYSPAEVIAQFTL